MIVYSPWVIIGGPGFTTAGSGVDPCDKLLLSTLPSWNNKSDKSKTKLKCTD